MSRGGVTAPGQPGHQNSARALITEVQPERLLLKLIVQAPASREPAALLFWGGFVWPEQWSADVQVVVCVSLISMWALPCASWSRCKG